jgi:G3E family GTPase
MKIIILGGLLGSGKTSVLMSFAKELSGIGENGKPKVVVIENEIGETGVDDKLLKTGGYKVENMFSGCACCTMSGEMVQNVKDIKRDFDPEMIIIESSGVGYPHEIKAKIKKALDLNSSIVAVVDAKRWKRMLIPMETMLKDQLIDTDFIFVNKIDLVDQEMIDFVNGSVKTFVPEAKVFDVSAVSGIDESIIHEVLTASE